MKEKKFLIGLALVVIIIAMAISSTVFAATDVNVVCKELNLASDPDSGIEYSLDNGDRVITKIGIGNDSGAFPRNVNAYCANANIGFETLGRILKDGETTYTDHYNKRYYMNDGSDRSLILNQGLFTDNYDKILALSDTMYLSTSDEIVGNTDYIEYIKPVVDLYLKNTVIDYSDSVSDSDFQSTYGMTKAQFLNNYCSGEEFTYHYSFMGNEEDITVTPKLITPDQIRAVQQATLWYFTNGFDYTNLDKYSNEVNFLYTRENASQVIVNQLNSDDLGKAQNVQAKILYNYLIETAEANVTANYEAINNVYLYLDDEADDEQPIVVIEKVYPEFDLALRKFITTVKDSNGNTISTYNEAQNRLPDTSEAVDLTGTGLKEAEKTAKKEHTKTPVVVKKGNRVVYTIRIYNEGTVKGWADLVTDYLPEGLDFIEDSTINTQYGWNYDETTRKVTTNYLADKELQPANRDWSNFNADDAEGKYYYDLEIECLVNENAKSNNMKNIAEITRSHGKNNLTDVDSRANSITGYPTSYNPTHPTTGRGEEDDDDFEELTLNFDLALRKYITKVKDKNGNVVSDNLGRIPDIDESTIPTTATYKHKKDPVSVQTGYFVYYTLTVYNEGEVDGYAKQIKDQLPQGLKYDSVVSGAFEYDSYDENNNLLTLRRKAGLETQKAYETTKLKDYSESVVIKCEVTGTASKKILTNLAWISIYHNNDENEDVERDVDSYPTTPDRKPNKDELVTDEVGYTGKTQKTLEQLKENAYFEGQEDDDDFEKIIIENFDLALRKFATKITTKASDYTEYTEYDDTTKDGNRVPNVTGNTVVVNKETNEKEDTTAEKKHPKDRIKVSKGDKVVYTIRVYNEGFVAGRAAEVTDYLPEGLDLIPAESSEINTRYGWVVGTDNKTITTSYMKTNNVVLTPVEGADNFDKLNNLDGENKPIYYFDLQVECIVNDKATSDVKSLRNIAAITKYEDENGNEITDIDSEDGQIDTENYNPKNSEEGIGEQDDDDLENLKLVEFDLALRKFITKVETQDDNGTTVKERVITDRVPELSIDETTGNIKYTHTKEPVNVLPKDIITYTLRIFNEGNTAGYATVITDDIPKGVEFLPENDLNKEYRWKMYKEITSEEAQTVEDKVVCKVKEDEEPRYFVETLDPKEASIIRTDYLSKDQGDLKLAADNTLTKNPNLLEAFDKTLGLTDTNPDHRDVKVAFRMIEDYGSDKIVINYAQISDDKDEDGHIVDDIDSETDLWNEGEDDQDIEKIRVPNFDLALRKWVTQAIVIENGEETITNTNHDPWDDPEDVVKVELGRKNLDDVVVKFRYSIRVYNQGDPEKGFVEGYATEVKDHIPQGLKFVQEDNPDWTEIEDNVIVTNKLAKTLLKTGEYADVEVILTWINGEDNLGIKTNMAEISEDYNEWGSPDCDSEPDNGTEKHEDDDDIAEVMLSIKTGEDKSIIFISLGIGLGAMLILAGGIFLIKKYVL